MLRVRWGNTGGRGDHIRDVDKSSGLNRGKNQPRYAFDNNTNTTLRWYCHGYPVITPYTFTRDIEYVSKRIDAIGGGDSIVIAISLGAHFTAFPLILFQRRLLNIRAAVERLHARWSPRARVVVKLANTRNTGDNIEVFNNWNTFQFNSVMLEAFRGLEVAFVDAWEMTASISMRMIHPSDWVVKNQIDLFLSYIC
ncbi:unnamed protein product [Lampetra planeri]